MDLLSAHLLISIVDKAFTPDNAYGSGRDTGCQPGAARSEPRGSGRGRNMSALPQVPLRFTWATHMPLLRS